MDQLGMPDDSHHNSVAKSLIHLQRSVASSIYLPKR